MRLSRRIEGASESETLRLSGELARLRREGKDIINLLEGEADLPPPPAVTAATIRALRAGETRYSSSRGLPELRSLLSRRHGGQGVLVTNGAKQALYTALQTLCGPGDEAIVLSPYWVTFPEAAKLAGAKPVFVPVEGDQPDPSLVAKALTRRTKALVLNSPNNPTGAVYSAEVLKELVKLARKRDIHIVSDEAYADLVYDVRHVSPASLGPDAARRTLTIRTFSKSYSMTGFRVGYLAGDEAVVAAVSAKLHSHLTGNVSAFVQRGAIAALGLSSGHLERRRRIFERRRDLAFAATKRLFPCAKPAGGFFVFPEIGGFLGGRFKSSAEFARHLLVEGRVAVVPGSACGRDGHLRISFSSSEENILAGFERIEGALCR